MGLTPFLVECIREVILFFENLNKNGQINIHHVKRGRDTDAHLFRPGRAETLSSPNQSVRVGRSLTLPGRREPSEKSRISPGVYGGRGRKKAKGRNLGGAVAPAPPPYLVGQTLAT